MIKNFNKISKKDLLKYNGFYANIVIPSGKIVQGGKIFAYKLKKATFLDKIKRKLGIKNKDYKIYSEKELLESPYIEIAFVSNDLDLDGGGKKLPPYEYSYIIYSVEENLDENNNDAFLHLDIYD